MSTAGTGTARSRPAAAADGTAGTPDGEPPKVDGRAARATRTRAAIVDALLALLEEGDLQPPATRIAERAGISLRLIYHHFGDLESLFRDAASRQAERLAAVAQPVDPDLPLEERIEQFCARRGRILEWMTPVRRASLLQEPFSEELSRAKVAFLRAGERAVRDLFHPELAELADPDRAEVEAALSAVAGWSTWDALRTSGNDEAACVRVLVRTFRALLGADTMP